MQRHFPHLSNLISQLFRVKTFLSSFMFKMFIIERCINANDKTSYNRRLFTMYILNMCIKRLLCHTDIEKYE